MWSSKFVSSALIFGLFGVECGVRYRSVARQAGGPVREWTGEILPGRVQHAGGVLDLVIGRVLVVLERIQRSDLDPCTERAARSLNQSR